MLNLARGIVISAALVFVCWWALQGSPSFQTCIQQDQKQSTDNHPESYISAFTASANAYRDCLGEFVHDRKDEILVAFTVILAFSTIFLWVATRDLVKSAERTSRHQLRAYLGVEHLGISKVAPNEKPLITARIRNFGQTPAYEVYYFLEVIIADKDNKRFALDRETGSSGKIVLNPSDVFAVRCSKDAALTEEEHAAIVGDTRRIFFFGEIHYRDAFKRPRITLLRYETSGAALTAEGMLRISQEGNKAT